MCEWQGVNSIDGTSQRGWLVDDKDQWSCDGMKVRENN